MKTTLIAPQTLAEQNINKNFQQISCLLSLCVNVVVGDSQLDQLPLVLSSSISEITFISIVIGNKVIKPN